MAGKYAGQFHCVTFSQGPLIFSDLFNGELSTERETDRQKEGEKKHKKDCCPVFVWFFCHRNERFCDRTALMTELSLRCFPLCLPLFKSVRFLFLF